MYFQNYQNASPKWLTFNLVLINTAREQIIEQKIRTGMDEVENNVE